jgi:hypothetical protein
MRGRQLLEKISIGSVFESGAQWQNAANKKFQGAMFFLENRSSDNDAAS